MTKTRNSPPAKPEIPKRTSPTLEFLPVRYTDAQLLEMGTRLARAGNEKEQTEEQFEVIKLHHKQTVEALEASMRTLTRNISRGSHYENVDCIWMLEDPTLHEKTLVRLDTGEIVRIVPMDRSDMQEVLIPEAIQPSSKPMADSSTDHDFRLESPANGKQTAANDQTPQNGNQQ